MSMSCHGLFDIFCHKDINTNLFFEIIKQRTLNHFLPNLNCVLTAHFYTLLPKFLFLIKTRKNGTKQYKDDKNIKVI